jgi:hypothetical protein
MLPPSTERYDAACEKNTPSATARFDSLDTSAAPSCQPSDCGSDLDDDAEERAWISGSPVTWSPDGLRYRTSVTLLQSLLNESITSLLPHRSRPRRVSTLTSRLITAPSLPISTTGAVNATSAAGPLGAKASNGRSFWLAVAGYQQEVGVEPCPAESATGLMGKLPHDGNVAVWPWCSVPCGLRLLSSKLSRLTWPTPMRRFSCLARTGGALLVGYEEGGTHRDDGTETDSFP